MSAPGRAPASRKIGNTLVVEGYASLFGQADLSLDVLRPGAFARSLRETAVPMLLQHRPGAIVGRWSRLNEDGCGLFVRGVIEADSARQLVSNQGLDGLSIGFRPRLWSMQPDGGRLLADVDLVEISLVAEPMLRAARFRVL